MNGFYKIYTVQFYDAAQDVTRVQVFVQEALAWDYFLRLRRELLGSRKYVSHSLEDSCFEGYLTDDMGRDYIEYKAWNLTQLPRQL